MARWDPDAHVRLEQAAVSLYLERGFEHVTVAEIAERAGLTKRTFFRYFADKREVLFTGAAAFQDGVVSAVAGADPGTAPVDAVVGALAAAGARLAELGELARRRRDLIAGSADLQERELIKMASLAQAVAEALRRRGVEARTAGLTAQAGVAAFTAAYERWVDEAGASDFPALVRSSMDDLRLAISPQGSGPVP